MTEMTMTALDAETLGMLTDSIDRYGREKYDFDSRKGWIASVVGFGVDAWKDYAGMGWLAAPMSLDSGGLGSDPAAISALMRYAGTRLALEPIFANAVLCGPILAQSAQANDGTALKWLEEMAAGRLLFAFAHAEDLATGMESVVQTSSEGGTLTGRKVVVLHGDVADWLLVSAIESSTGALSLYAVPTSHPRVKKMSYRLLDGRGAASFDFSAAQGTLVGPVGGAKPVIDGTLDHARLALCSEAHGAMRALNEQTLAYLKDRRQFGRPIGNYQALQHRMVELFMLEQETAAVIAAGQRASRTGGLPFKKTVAGAVAHTITAGRQISHEAVQMHGGIGTTDELAVSHYFKRIMVLNRLIGDRDAHLDAFAKPVTEFAGSMS